MPADLVVLAMNDFDVIFGMDWLAKYKACLDYFRKIITFRVDEASANLLFKGVQKKYDTRLVSALKAERLIRSGCEGYITFIYEKKPVHELRNIPVVCQFPDVFPDEVPDLPPARKVDFTIELVPGTAPTEANPRFHDLRRSPQVKFENLLQIVLGLGPRPHISKILAQCQKGRTKKKPKILFRVSTFPLPTYSSSFECTQHGSL
eukprot:TRINITY_DN5934_c0_g2_i1.p1 TRINITY_DN5934_c0_g2~~TRINITY_DN5934_c0_g2_i1.p1  ORF type:complete len:205 (+),score=20.53 TRINITY_DN5934_c0_g2_i1:397-1011(+)